MITKERLEELIEKGATIYNTDYLQLGEIHLNKNDYVEQNGTLHTKLYKCGYDYFYNERLFETKEEAEWYLKFGDIERTETLSLPTFEEIIKEVGMNGTYNIEFTSKNEWDECTLSVCTSRQYIVVEGYKHWNLTKANYIEACELAKKIFLGEEI